MAEEVARRPWPPWPPKPVRRQWPTVPLVAPQAADREAAMAALDLKVLEAVRRQWPTTVPLVAPQEADREAAVRHRRADRAQRAQPAHRARPEGCTYPLFSRVSASELYIYIYIQTHISTRFFLRVCAYHSYVGSNT